jgi:hypothetical protein
MFWRKPAARAGAGSWKLEVRRETQTIRTIRRVLAKAVTVELLALLVFDDDKLGCSARPLGGGNFPDFGELRRLAEASQTKGKLASPKDWSSAS